MKYLACNHTADKEFAEGGVVLEGSIMMKGEINSAGSKILENFHSPFSAAVTEKLADAGIGIAGIANMDEFGINSVFPGGDDTVEGVIEAVADGYADAALANDFSGKKRRQAPEHGLCYIHPTYGTVSRYGLIPLIASMDQIGVVCRDLSKGFDTLSAIAGKDDRDGAMLTQKSYSYAADGKAPKAAIPTNVLKCVDQNEQDIVKSFSGNFEAMDTELKYFDVYSQVMYILGCAEISNNINRYDGVKFGYRADQIKTLNDLYLKTRTEGFGRDTKLAAILGSMVLSVKEYDKYYDKAMRVRRLIKESLEFDKYDIIVMPVGKGMEPYAQNSLYALATLAGLPSVSIPYGQGAVQIIANVCNENALLTAWEAVK